MPITHPRGNRPARHSPETTLAPLHLAWTRRPPCRRASRPHATRGSSPSGTAARRGCSTTTAPIRCGHSRSSRPLSSPSVFCSMRTNRRHSDRRLAQAPCRHHASAALNAWLTVPRRSCRGRGLSTAQPLAAGSSAPKAEDCIPSAHVRVGNCDAHCVFAHLRLEANGCQDVVLAGTLRTANSLHLREQKGNNRQNRNGRRRHRRRHRRRRCGDVTRTTTSNFAISSPVAFLVM